MGKKRPPVKEDEYEVENIIAYRHDGLTDLYRVRWKGYPPEDDTWETAENLAGAPKFHGLMQVLKRKAQTQPKPAPVSGESDEDGSKKKRKKMVRDPRENDPSRPFFQQASQESPGRDDEAAERVVPTTEQIRAAASCPMGLGEVLSCAEDDEFDAEAEAEEPFVMYNGIKVPKAHLPDEKALGSRLKVVRLKRAVDRSASPLPADAQPDDSRNGAGALRHAAEGGGLDASGGALYGEESDEELGKDLLVSYLIDGRSAYTIPFTAARRYCCQQLLSFLLRRLTFRGEPRSPTGACPATAPSATVATEGGKAKVAAEKALHEASTEAAALADGESARRKEETSSLMELRAMEVDFALAPKMAGRSPSLPGAEASSARGDLAAAEPGEGRKCPFMATTAAASLSVLVSGNMRENGAAFQEPNSSAPDKSREVAPTSEALLAAL